jgi:hypothetical protein
VFVNIVAGGQSAQGTGPTADVALAAAVKLASEQGWLE